MKNTILHLRFCISLLGIMLLISACRPDHQKLAEVPADDRGAPVFIETLEVTYERPLIRAIGRVAPADQIRQSFKVGGILEAVYVQEGDRYRAGQILARLNRREIDAQVRKATEAVTKLERDAARVARLYADTVATLEQKQDLNTALEVARADLEIARYNQEHAVIVARNSGRVLQRLAEPGELIAPGNPVFLSTVEGAEDLVVKAGLVDREVVQVEVGDSATVRLDAWPNERFAGLVTVVAPQADPRSGTFEVEIALFKNDLRLRPGFIAELELRPGSHQPYYKIPMQAVRNSDNQVVGIYLADTAAGQARFHEAKLSVLAADYVLVDTTDFPPHLPLVTDGAAFLTSNTSIYLP